jgi:hypothetical protein
VSVRLHGRALALKVVAFDLQLSLFAGMREVALVPCCCWRVIYTLLGKSSPVLHLRIVDPSQRPVPHAKVAVLSKASTIFQGTTGKTGELDASIAPSRNQLDIQCDGFSEQRSSITMLNRDQKITISLSIKKETVFVTVSDQGTKLDTASDLRPR